VRLRSIVPSRLRQPLKRTARRAENLAASTIPVRLLTKGVTAAVKRADAQQIDDLIPPIQALHAALVERVSPAHRRRQGWPLELGAGVQAKQYMIELLPHVQRHLATYERGRELSLLDVGPGTGHGTELLASMYASGELGYRLVVTTVDVDDSYQRYIRVIGRHIDHRIGNIYTMNETYDLVTASHVIEHVLQPLQFCRRLQELARGAAFIVAPFNEPRDRLTVGHRNVIDHAFLEELQPRWYEIVHSPGWGAFFDPPYEMLIAELTGAATAG
jgi:hypothetical protein